MPLAKKRGVAVQSLNQSLLNKTPSGVTDILLDEAQLKTHIEACLRKVVEAWGYVEVITPMFEFYDVLLTGGIDPNWMYKFSDPDGSVLALRSDLTTPIARVVATNLRAVPEPLRLYYIGHVFRRPKSGKGRCAEFSQAGIELIGPNVPSADAEVVAAAIEALQQLGLTDFQANLGQIGFFKGLIENLALPEADIALIKARIDRRDRADLERILNERNVPSEKKKLLLAMLNLCGGEETIEHAFALADNKTSQEAVENLAEIYEILAEYNLTDRVVVDLSEVRGFGYYTGMMFEGFTRSLGFPILKGGRYDDLIGKFSYSRPAVGCAFDINRIRKIVQKEELVALPKVDALVRFSQENRNKAYKLAKTLRAQGKHTELEVIDRSEEEAIAYARQKGITKLLVLDPGGKRVVTLQTLNSKDQDQQD
jgi:ATP phosphoribosyltransferase regulatory subunit